MRTRIKMGRKFEAVVFYFNCRDCGSPLAVCDRERGVCRDCKKRKLDQRKFTSADTSARKSEGGKRGAAKMKARAEALGTHYSAFARLPAADDAAVAARIDEIVRRAEERGDCHNLSVPYLKVRMTGAEKVG